MVRYPYETTLLNKVNNKQLYHEIDQAIVTNTLANMTPDTIDEFEIYAVVEPNERIDVFYHPIYRELTGRKPAIVYDARAFKNNIVIDNGYGKIRQGLDTLELLQLSSILTGIWQTNPNAILSCSDVPYLVYGSLLTETLGRKLGLDPQSQLRVMCTFQIFYMTRGYQTLERFGKEERISLATALARKGNIDVNTYNEIIDVLESEDLADFISIVEFIRNQKWSPRLNNLSARDVYSMVMNAWIGQGNPKETTLVAIEYPPTWVSIVYFQARSTFYQKLPIGQILKRLDRGNNLKGFEQQVLRLSGPLIN